jgi:prevent-host-death family protein
MTVHVAETDTELSEVIDRVLKGEEVVVMRNGQPVARVNGVIAAAEPEKRITPESVKWLEEHRVGKGEPRIDSATLIRQMRDEGY